MSNPFDKTFFRFVFGFSIILLISFAILYFTMEYSHVLDGKDMIITTEK